MTSLLCIVRLDLCERATDNVVTPLRRHDFARSQFLRDCQCRFQSQLNTLYYPTMVMMGTNSYEAGLLNLGVEGLELHVRFFQH